MSECMEAGQYCITYDNLPQIFRLSTAIFSPYYIINSSLEESL